MKQIPFGSILSSFILPALLLLGSCVPRPGLDAPPPDPEPVEEDEPEAVEEERPEEERPEEERPEEEQEALVEAAIREAEEVEREALAEERAGLADPDDLIVATTGTSIVRPATREPRAELIDRLVLPAGFRIEVVAENLENPRVVEVTDEGHVYVTEREAGRVTLLAELEGAGEGHRTVASGLGEGLSGVHGLASRDGYLFLVTETELYVAEILSDGGLGEPELLLDDIPTGGQHPNRTIRWGPDRMLYLSVGSTCNACVEPVGEHAALVRMDPETGEREVYAEGLRNTIGFDWHPVSGRLYGLDHNTDGRGDEWPVEELNRIEEGAHYGWPHCWGDRQVDPHLPAEPPDGRSREAFCADTEAPVLTYLAHAAPMQMEYYRADHFPAEYRGDAFATMRGSWNRNPPVGYEVVRIRHDTEGNPVSIEPFVTGWLIEGGRAHFGRLTGLAVAPDGSLLISDDENGVIYRVRYEGAEPGGVPRGR